MSGPSREDVKRGLQFEELVEEQNGILTGRYGERIKIMERRGAEVIPIDLSWSDIRRHEEFYARLGMHAPDGTNAFKKGRVIRDQELDYPPTGRYDLHPIFYFKIGKI
jgi:hypothetical protein